MEDTLVVEMKSVRVVTDIHRKQLLSYLKLTAMPLGLLINFNVTLLRQGIIRVINLPATGVAGQQQQQTVTEEAARRALRGGG